MAKSATKKNKSSPAAGVGNHIGISDKDRGAIAALRNAIYACDLQGVTKLS